MREAIKRAAALLAAFSAALSVAAAPAAFGADVGEPVAVIVNRGNPVAALTELEIKAIYSGQAPSWDDGSPLTPYDLTAADAAREAFSTAVFRMPPQRVDEELAGLKLANRASNPPIRLKDQTAVVQRVSEERGAIGYVFYRNAADNPHVRIIFLIDRYHE